MSRKIDLAGQRFGRLLIKQENGRSSAGNILWLCVCDCGNVSTVNSNNLRNGSIRSCGCFAREQAKIAHTTHGMKGTPIYTTWAAMNSRCTNLNDPAFSYYGERGIMVCERWGKSFENFYADMGNKPKGMSIERLNNNLGYSPTNCCWADSKTQNRNSRNTRFIEYKGEVKCIAEWAEELGINYGTLYFRLCNHPPEIAFTM